MQCCNGSIHNILRVYFNLLGGGSENALLFTFLVCSKLISFQMKLYATYYRHERIVITDDYPIISVRDVKGGKLDKYFRSATYSTILFVSVLLGLPLICLVSVIIIVKGARWQIRKTLNSERVSFQASFSSTVAIGWVFSLFVLVMDAAAIYEANVDNNILSNQASHEYGSLPLFWITGVTVAIDVASFVIGMVLLIASARYKSSECCNIFCHCTCKCKENVSKKPEIELDTVPFGVNSDKTEAEKPENERVNSDKTEAEKPENERVNSDKTEAEKPENERVNSDKTEAEKPENERVNSDKTEAEKERVNSDKTEAEKERVNSRERRMWLIMISLIAPIVCFGSHVGYCIIAWLSFPSTGSAVFTMYTLTFTFYFITLRQLYVALVTWSAPKTKYSTDSKKQRLMVSEERAKYKEIGKEGVNVYVLFALIGAGILLAVCQVWLASGLVLLPISNLIESAPLYLQSAVNTAFLTITGLFALNIFVIKPRKKNRQDKILKFVLQNMKQPADTSTTQPPKAAQESAIPGKAQQPATTEEYSREEELGNLIAKLLVSNLEVIEIFKEKNSRK